LHSGDLFAVKVRNRLDVAEREDLRLSLTAVQPDIYKFAGVHQAERTHWM